MPTNYNYVVKGARAHYSGYCVWVAVDLKSRQASAVMTQFDPITGSAPALSWLR